VAGEGWLERGGWRGAAGEGRLARGGWRGMATMNWMVSVDSDSSRSCRARERRVSVGCLSALYYKT
jgi:hypothetical protein